MQQISVGCSGWSYTSWVEHFYPKGLEQSKWLQHYAEVFDYVEIDSTFYSIPSPFRVKKWASNTPASFKFSAKMPKVITHDKAMSNALRELELFYSAMNPLKAKLLALLIQLPPSISFKTGFYAMKSFVSILDRRYRYAVEVRHPSWFNDDFYQFLQNNEVCLTWNQLDIISAPPIVTTDFVYIRLIGDRSIQEHEFGRIQKERTSEMEKWAAEIRNVETKSSCKFGIVAANNHYAGFGPLTANTFRKLLGLPERQFFGEKAQARLPDFGL